LVRAAPPRAEDAAKDIGANTPAHRSPAEAQQFVRAEFALWNRITSEVKIELPE
jgi:hypothetical protein